MDTQQARRIEEAAQKFAEAIMESYRAVSDRAVSAQEPNAQSGQWSRLSAQRRNP